MIDLDAVMARMVLATGWTTGIGAYGSERRVTIDAALADIPALVERVRLCLVWHEALTRWEQTGTGYEDMLLAEAAAREALAEYEAARNG